MVDHFGLTAARRIKSAHGEAGLIIANHVAAHVPDLDDFFGGIAHLLAASGSAVIESQYVGDLLVGNQFDHVYHEHRYFYSMTSLGNVAMRHGLYLQNVELTEPQGGSVQITLGKREWHSIAVVDLFKREAEWLQDLNTYAGFQGRVDHIRDKLVDLVDHERRAGRRVAGYGASAKSTTLLNYCELSRNKIEYVEDTTPHKIGYLTPGTHIPVVSPGDQSQPDTYLLLVWNYASAILRREADFMAKGGRFIVPIPTPVLL
jgi:novobiocin biosynthesis protein NovU/D-mycarose 3-C-methyltransferase